MITQAAPLRLVVADDEENDPECSVRYLESVWPPGTPYCLLVDGDRDYTGRLLKLLGRQQVAALVAVDLAEALRVVHERPPYVAVVAADAGAGSSATGLLTVGALRTVRSLRHAVPAGFDVLLASPNCATPGLFHRRRGAPIAVLPKAELAVIVRGICDPDGAFLRCQAGERAPTEP